MKIALIGNMNNNNFAVMRYFRDLGADAHLLLYKNDGQDNLSHFKPECDTWNIEQWRPFIRQTELINSYISAVGNVFPYREFFMLKRMIKFLRRDPGHVYYRLPKPQYVAELLSEFDTYIGPGVAPVILNSIGLTLDIFYPYSAGIEFLGSQEFLALSRSGRYGLKSAMRRVAQAQEKGIRRAKYCINAEMSLTRNVFNRIGVPFVPMAIPMVYNREVPRVDDLPDDLRELREEMKSYDFTIVMHSRLIWVNPGNYSNAEWEQASKNSEWLVKSYAKFTSMRPDIKCRLFILEYGPDVGNTKSLCIELGIQDRVRWLPKMARRELMQVISWCDVGVGEFYSENVLWGGTGWEVLACGKPLLQSFRYKEGEFESAYGYPPPPMLPVRSPECILKHLIDMADRPEKRAAIGQGAVEWFNRYNGIGLAQQWLDLLSGDR